MTKSKKQVLNKNESDVSKNEEDLFAILQSGESSELYDVIKQLMTGNEDLDLKTEVNRPRSLAVLTVLIEFYKENNLKNASKILEIFREKYLRYMVSFNRNGRKELVEILRERKKDLEETEVVE